MATKGVNKCILIGSLGNDPESRSFPDGGMVTNISVATSESWKDKQTGQQQEKTEWHKVVLKDRGAFKLGQIAAQYLKKGSKVYIEGSLKTRSYDKDGQKHYVTEIIADQMQMLDGRTEGQASAPQAQPANNLPNYNHGIPNVNQFDDFDDDIPF